MTVRELAASPNLATLYPKAALGGIAHSGGKTLPDTELVLPGATVDGAELAAYNDVCGFPLTDELPATYPHVLAFPLQMLAMTEPGFPFPLLGMVHVANRITQHRPVRIDEEFTLKVRTQNLRDHAKGKQFDVISELVPSDSDSPVWTDVSTYLRRGDSGGTGERKAQLAAPASNVIWRIPGDIGRRYASVSGDRNPIHLHSLTAKAFGFPAAIAHGMWTKAHALAAFQGRLPSAFTIDVQFAQPVLLPAKAAFTTWQTDQGWAFELWKSSRTKPKPHLSGSITAL